MALLNWAFAAEFFAPSLRQYPNSRLEKVPKVLRMRSAIFHSISSEVIAITLKKPQIVISFALIGLGTHTEHHYTRKWRTRIQWQIDV